MICMHARHPCRSISSRFPSPASLRRRLGLNAGLFTLLLTGAHAETQVSDYKKLSLSELMDLQVTSVSRRPEKLSDAASSIQVVTGDDIRRSGASSIPEALRLADNLNVAQKGAQGWAISARGFNTELSNKLLVLMDGRTLYSPLFSGVFWNAQDYVLEDIDRIEVISGPGGALWGANAVNGVINISTKSAKDTQGLYTEVAAGTELRNLTSVRYGGVLAPDVHYRVYAKYFDRDAGVLPNGASASTGWNMWRTGFRIDSESTPQTTLTLQGDIYGNDENLPGGQYNKLGGGNLLGRWTHTLENDSEMSLQFYYDRTNLSQPVPASIFSPIAGRLTNSLDTYDLDFQHRIRWGERNQVVWGLGYRFTHDDTTNAPGLGFQPAELNQSLVSAFAQDEITLGGGVSLTIGTKVEHNDYTGVEIEPNTRLQWNVTPAQMVWGAVSRAVRMPSRVDRDLRRPSTGPAIFSGGANYESETVIAYELGYRAQLGPKVIVAVSAFYNCYDDVRSLGTTPVTFLPLVFENNVEGETHGVELTATYEVNESWRLRGGYTLLVENLRVKPGELDINNALNETADPRNQFSFRSSFNLPRRVELDTGLRWVDTLRQNNAGAVAKVPAYFELDVRLAWHATDQLELSLVGQNLLHERHPEYGLPGPGREEIARGVYAKVVWRY